MLPNDETEFMETYSDPNQNPWYVLSTLYGTDSHDASKRNRAAWNSWVSQKLSQSELIEILSKRFTPPYNDLNYSIDEIYEFPNAKEAFSWQRLKDEILAKFRMEWKLRNGDESPVPELPNPEDIINLNGIKFDEPLVMNGFIFTSNLNLSNCRFENVFNCDNSVFLSGISSESSLIASCSFRNCYFDRTVVFSGNNKISSAYFTRSIFNYNLFIQGEYDILDMDHAIIKGNADFTSTTISTCKFEQTNFTRLVRFVGTKFLSYAYFNGAKFLCLDSEYADFTNADFQYNVDFGNAKFGNLVLFNNANFSGQTLFWDSIFYGKASFSAVNFHEGITFKNARFFDGLSLTGSKFGGELEFYRSTFEAYVNFSRSEFDGTVYFDEASFSKAIDNNSVVFSGCRFHEPLSFQLAKFSLSYPIFSGAILPDDISFSAKNEYWPKSLNQNLETARESLARIRHLVDKNGFVEDAHFFYRREMMLNQHIGSCLRRLPFVLYGSLSNFGSSISKPLMLLFITWILCTVFLFFLLNSECLIALIRDISSPPLCTNWTIILPAEISLSNSLPFLGMNKLIYSDFYTNASFSIKVILIFQTLISVILIFLLALGFRTKFRMR